MANITKEEIKIFLKDHYLMQVATISGDQPGISVLLYTIDENLKFYFSSNRDSFKVKNLLANPKVSLVVWEFGKVQVQANGLAELLENEIEKEKIMDQLADSATKDKDFWPPLLKFNENDYVIIRIKPTWMRTLDLSSNTVKQDENPFTEIKL